MPDADGGAIALLLTALVLGLRHGIDWDHLAAIADITSTTSAAEAAESEHADAHAHAPAHHHRHGGEDEMRAHVGEPEAPHPPPPALQPQTPSRLLQLERRPVVLGTLYALGHALVVGVLGTAALLLGAQLPDWVDPLMGRIVNVADSYDTILTSRSYKNACSAEAAFEELIRCKGTQFDPNIVDSFYEAYKTGQITKCDYANFDFSKLH